MRGNRDGLESDLPSTVAWGVVPLPHTQGPRGGRSRPAKGQQLNDVLRAGYPAMAKAYRPVRVLC
jgi:hypothetical protein